MESNNSSLRAVLNNIASIQHELANRQTQLLDSDILMQLKGLAAQLYLESDIELLSLSDEEHVEETVMPAEVVEVGPVVEVAPVVAVPPVVEVAPVVEATPVVESLNGGEKSGKTVDEVISAMPLSRRFEFANILFGGDMQKMGMFIQQFIDAPNAAGRLDVYDQWYEEKQWRRRDESASDMLRMLKRMFAS